MPDTLELIDQIIPFIIKEQSTLQQSMSYAAKVLQSHLTPSTQKLLSDHNFKDSETALLAQITGMIISEPPTPTVKAYLFGLLDMQGGMFKKYEYQRLYLCGSVHFDPEDEDWACDPAWFPDSRYFAIPLLNKIGKSQHASEPTAGYVLSLAFAAAVGVNFGPLIASHTDQSNHPVPIATGHDSGEIHVLGYASPESMQQSQ